MRSALVGLGVLLTLQLSVGLAWAQAQQQNVCLANLYTELQKRNIPEKQKDFETDRDNAQKAIQAAIKAGTLGAGLDTIFSDSVQAIVCHIADTPNLPLVKAEQDTRLKEAVAKLRNLFQRIANPVAGADDLKDWLAKLQFARWIFSLGKNGKDRKTNQYIWNILRLELIVNNAGAPQEGVFAVPAGGTDIDLVLFSKNKIGATLATWNCPGAGPGGLKCFGLIQDAIVLLQTKDVANAATLLGAPQQGGAFAGGAGTFKSTRR